MDKDWSKWFTIEVPYYLILHLYIRYFNNWNKRICATTKCIIRHHVQHQYSSWRYHFIFQTSNVWWSAKESKVVWFLSAWWSNLLMVKGFQSEDIAYKSQRRVEKIFWKEKDVFTYWHIFFSKGVITSLKDYTFHQSVNMTKVWLIHYHLGKQY